MKKLKLPSILVGAALGLLVFWLIDSRLVSGQSPPVTYNRQIAPLFRQRCEECHRPGGVAPMSFLTYEETRPWARAIREKVVTRAMPPFHATGALGRFHDDPRLTDQEIALITRWVDSGAPKGKGQAPRRRPVHRRPAGPTASPTLFSMSAKPTDSGGTKLISMSSLSLTTSSPRRPGSGRSLPARGMRGLSTTPILTSCRHSSKSPRVAISRGPLSPARAGRS